MSRSINEGNRSCPVLALDSSQAQLHSRTIGHHSFTASHNSVRLKDSGGVSFALCNRLRKPHTQRLVNTTPPACQGFLAPFVKAL
jgi:hypothetical protein